MNILQETENWIDVTDQFGGPSEPATNIIEQGGPVFMIPLLLLLLLIVFLFLRGLKNNTVKNSDLIKSVSLFSLALGVLGAALGMLEALDAIMMANDVGYHIIAAGLYVNLIAPTFGLIIFLVARLFDVVLRWKRE